MRWESDDNDDDYDDGGGRLMMLMMILIMIMMEVGESGRQESGGSGSELGAASAWPGRGQHHGLALRGRDGREAGAGHGGQQCGPRGPRDQAWVYILEILAILIIPQCTFSKSFHLIVFWRIFEFCDKRGIKLMYNKQNCTFVCKIL